METRTEPVTDQMTTDQMTTPEQMAPGTSSLQSSPPPYSPLSPFSPSPASASRTGTSDVDDTASTVSVASSASSAEKGKVAIPDSWPPAIMACIQQPSEEEQKRTLTPLLRNEIVRVLATQIFCVEPNPKKELITLVAKKLVAKYTFMRDTGEKVSGYVSGCASISA